MIPFYLDHLFDKVKQQAAGPDEDAAWQKLVFLMKQAQAADPPVSVEMGVGLVLRLESLQQVRLVGTEPVDVEHDQYEVPIAVSPKQPKGELGNTQYSFPLQ